jgi:ubiquinone/menaquinone biosynthesis C-methylase UbiE
MNIRNWQKFFKDEAPRYLDNCFTKNTEFEIDFLIKELNLKTGDHILDVGCGTGRHSLGLAKKGMFMTGIDLSFDMLEMAKQKAKEEALDITFIQGDASKVTLDQKFDNAICICEGAFGLYEKGIEPFSYHLDILKNVNRMLKPGGKFLMTVLNGFKKIREHSDEDIKNEVFDPFTMTTICKLNLNDGSAVTVYEKGFLPHELKEMLIEAGFKVNCLCGGTAGAWNKEELKLDEYEIMIIAEKSSC